MASKYAYRSHTSDAKIRRLLRYFSKDLEATNIARLTHLNRNTVNRYIYLLRDRIAEETGRTRGEAHTLSSEGDKTPMFSITAKDGTIVAEPLSADRVGEFRRILEEESADTRFSFPPWEELAAVASVKTRKILYLHPLDGVPEDRALIGNFWKFLQRRIVHLRGIHSSRFHLHLKETEWRFNHRHADLYTLLLSMLRKKPLTADAEPEPE